MPRIPESEGSGKLRDNVLAEAPGHQTSEFQHRDRPTASHVEYLEIRPGILQDQDIRPGHVLNVHKIPHLPPILVHHRRPVEVQTQTKDSTRPGVRIVQRLAGGPAQWSTAYTP